MLLMPISATAFYQVYKRPLHPYFSRFPLPTCAPPSCFLLVLSFAGQGQQLNLAKLDSLLDESAANKSLMD